LLQINLNFIGSVELLVLQLAGMILKLEGEANDYVGKGSRMVVKSLLSPRSQLRTRAERDSGNTCLYGATGGSLFC